MTCKFVRDAWRYALCRIEQPESSWYFDDAIEGLCTQSLMKRSFEELIKGMEELAGGSFVRLG